MSNFASSAYPVVEDSKGSDRYAIDRDGLKKQTRAALLTETTKSAKAALRIGGPTANRPTNPGNYTMYFDTTLGQPVWWDGLKWVDATGTTA